jgi:hypothetical protein
MSSVSSVVTRWARTADDRLLRSRSKNFLAFAKSRASSNLFS